jgi:hypothetical protein
MKTRISLIEDIDALCDLSMQEKSVLYTLGRYANADGTNVYPSQELLARHLKTTDRTIRRLFTSLEKKGYLGQDGMHKHRKKYRLYIPDRLTGIVPTKLLENPEEVITQEDWESKFLTDEELQGQGVQLPVEEPPVEEDLGGPLEDELEETQPRLQIVRPKPPPAVYQPPPETPAVYQPPGRQPMHRPLNVTSEELLRRRVTITKMGIMKYDMYMREGRKAGYNDEYLNWMLSGDVGKTGSSNGSQPYNEPDLITNLQERSYSTMDSIVT